MEVIYPYLIDSLNNVVIVCYVIIKIYVVYRDNDNDNEKYLLLIRDGLFFTHWYDVASMILQKHTPFFVSTLYYIILRYTTLNYTSQISVSVPDCFPSNWRDSYFGSPCKVTTTWFNCRGYCWLG